MVTGARQNHCVIYQRHYEYYDCRIRVKFKPTLHYELALEDDMSKRYNIPNFFSMYHVRHIYLIDWITFLRPYLAPLPPFFLIDSNHSIR